MKVRLVLLAVCAGLSAALFLHVHAQQPASYTARMEIPGVKGVVQIEVGPTPWDLAFGKDWTFLEAMNRQDKLWIQAHFCKVTVPASADSCKREFWQDLKPDYAEHVSELQESSKNGRVQVEYIFTGTENLKTRHLHAYWGARDLCAEVHLIKPNFVPGDQKLLDQVLASVQLLPDQSGLKVPGSQDSASYYKAEGDELYAQENYVAAIPLFEKALGLEKRNRSFDNEMFSDLIGSVGHAYRRTNSSLKAKDTFEYGLTKDPEDPILHFELACTYADLSQAKAALEHLGLMYRYKDKAGHHVLPDDPLKDYCFHEFVKDEQFVKAVRAMQ